MIWSVFVYGLVLSPPPPLLSCIVRCCVESACSVLPCLRAVLSCLAQSSLVRSGLVCSGFGLPVLSWCVLYCCVSSNSVLYCSISSCLVSSGLLLLVEVLSRRISSCLVLYRVHWLCQCVFSALLWSDMAWSGLSCLVLSSCCSV